MRYWIAAVFSFLSLLSHAHADCGPISSLMNVDIRKTDSVAQTILMSELAEMTFGEARQKYGAEFIYKGVPITANASSFNSFQSAMRQRSFSSNVWSNRTEVSKWSGDPILAQAYERCLQQRGGLSISKITSQNNSRRVALIIKYISYPGGPQAVKVDNITKNIDPGARVLDENRCLEKGYIYKDRVPCSLIMEFSSPWQAAEIIVVTEAGYDTIYFPPRLKLELIERPIPHFYRTNGVNVGRIIEWKSPGGNNTYGSFCTEPLPDGFKIKIPEEGLKPNLGVILPNPPPSSAGVNQFAWDTKYDKPGLYDEICGRANCGYPGGNDVWCGGVIKGSIAKWELVPDETNLPSIIKY